MDNNILATHSLHHVHKVGDMKDANFPKDSEGRVYHLGVKRGEVANRILSVGDSGRAERIAKLLDNPEKNFVRTSTRGFITYTGTKNKVPISIIATGMGNPMMDFVIRETRAVVDGPMAIIRLGTCGTIKEDVEIGSIVVASKGSTFILRNPDAFGSQSPDISPYFFCKPISSDQELSASLSANLKLSVRSSSIVEGMNASADTFYASQGRHDCNFTDNNKDIIPNLLEKIS